MQTWANSLIVSRIHAHTTPYMYWDYTLCSLRFFTNSSQRYWQKIKLPNWTTEAILHTLQLCFLEWNEDKANQRMYASSQSLHAHIPTAKSQTLAGKKITTHARHWATQFHITRYNNYIDTCDVPTQAFNNSWIVEGLSWCLTIIASDVDRYVYACVIEQTLPLMCGHANVQLGNYTKCVKATLLRLISVLQ